MAQIILFFIIFGVLLANGVGGWGALLGAIAGSFILGLVLVAVLAAMSK